MRDYLGIVVLLLVTAGLAGFLSFVAYILGPKRNTPFKSSPYECGVAPVGDAHERFPIKFYLVAILFILFDIEVVFLWPWMTTFKNSDTPFLIFSSVEFLTYIATWVLGYAYAMRVGAIDWDETTSLASEKFGIDTSNVGGGVNRPADEAFHRLPTDASPDVTTAGMTPGAGAVAGGLA